MIYLISLVTIKAVHLGFHLDFHWFHSSQFYVPGKGFLLSPPFHCSFMKLLLSAARLPYQASRAGRGGVKDKCGGEDDEEDKDRGEGEAGAGGVLCDFQGGAEAAATQDWPATAEVIRERDPGGGQRRFRSIQDRRSTEKKTGRRETQPEVYDDWCIGVDNREGPKKPRWR